MFLANAILALDHIFTDQIVLELGSGTGLTGLVAARCTEMKQLYLTDYAPQVLQNLRYNVEINQQMLEELYERPCRVQVLCLDWETWEWESQEFVGEMPSIIIAADCVYDVQGLPQLVGCLNRFFRSSNNDCNSKFALFASTVRNEATFARFLVELELSGLQYEDMTDDVRSRIAAMEWLPILTDKDTNSIRLTKIHK